jgi:anti-sigma B factor antagonist
MDSRPADLQLTTRWRNGHQIVAVAGEIDMCTAPTMRAYVLNIIGITDGDGDGRGGSDLVLDLSAVTFMDARGLSTLLWADHNARRAGRHLRLAAVTVPVIRLLAITHLDQYFDLHLTSEAATHAQLG